MAQAHWQWECQWQKICNFMLINFREDLQINLAPLPEGLQTLRSSVTAGHFREVYQMSRATTVFSAHVCYSRLGCMVDNSDLTRYGRARGEGDSVTEAFTLCP